MEMQPQTTKSQPYPTAFASGSKQKPPNSAPSLPMAALRPKKLERTEAGKLCGGRTYVDTWKQSQSQ